VGWLRAAWKGVRLPLGVRAAACRYPARSTQHAARSTAFLFVALLGLGAGCARPFGRIERAIQARLPEVVGPADAYDVRISRSAGRILGGTIGWLEIDGRNVRPNGNVQLDRVAVRLEGVRFEREQPSLREIRQASVQVRVSADSVLSFLRARNPRLADMELDFLPNRMRIVVPPSLLETEGPLVIEGRPVLVGPATVNWEASRIATLRDAVPEGGLRKLEEIFNPIVDLSSLRFALELLRVSVAPDGLTVAGMAALGPEQFQRAEGRGGRRVTGRARNQP
jgi:hypothetical protein